MKPTMSCPSSFSSHTANGLSKLGKPPTWRTLNAFAIILFLVGMTGCTTSYWSNRKRDAMDVFTLTVGTGVGAKMRVGSVHAGLAGVFDKTGLRGGLWGDQGDCRDFDLPWPAPCRTGETIAFGADLYEPENERRGKSYRAMSTFPFIYNEFQTKDVTPCYPPATFLTQVDLVGGFIGTVRIGFNVGELIDFALGWVTIDIYQDDLHDSTTNSDPNQR